MRTTKTWMAALLTFASLAANADDNTLLIQLEPSGHYRIWHTEGQSMLNEEETQILSETATPAGSTPIATSAGMASAQRTKNGVVVRLHDKQVDNLLLIDRDDCGGVKLWHGDGATQLPEDKLTELVMSALPTGGERLTLGDRYVRGYTVNLGVIAVIWTPKKR